MVHAKEFKEKATLIELVEKMATQRQIAAMLMLASALVAVSFAAYNLWVSFNNTTYVVAKETVRT